MSRRAENEPETEQYFKMESQLWHNDMRNIIYSVIFYVVNGMKCVSLVRGNAAHEDKEMSASKVSTSYYHYVCCKTTASIELRAILMRPVLIAISQKRTQNRIHKNTQ